MGRLLRGLGLVGSLALAVPAIADASVPSGFGESTVAAGLAQPTAIAFRPDGGMLVTEKGGAVRLVRGAETVTLTSLTVCTDKSMGLLGVAVDPGFSLNGFIYLYRTRPVGNEGPGCPTEPGRVNEIVRLRLEGDRVAEGPVPIFTGIRTDNGQHNGGTLRIGLDGKLYVSTGDTGVGDFLPGGFTPPGGSTNPFAQILGELPGKVLRIGLDGGIPADNPFVGVAGAREEVFAYGFRNPFRFGVDPVTGHLWLGDVGQNTWEELDIVRAGGNYGWPLCEGTDPPGCDPQGHVPPAFQYEQDVAGSLGASITGGAFAPCGFGDFAGQYFFGDYASDRLYRAVPNVARDGLAAAPAPFGDLAAGPVDIVFGPDGALYYVAIKAGEVRRVAAAGDSCPEPSPPMRPGGSGPSAPAGGVTADRTAPKVRLRVRSPQAIGPLEVFVRVDERATVEVSAKVRVRGRERARRYISARRWVTQGKEVRLRLRLSKRVRASLRRAAGRQPLAARLRLSAADGSGNVAQLARNVRLR